MCSGEKWSEKAELLVMPERLRVKHFGKFFLAMCRFRAKWTVTLKKSHVRRER